ncbi:MAG: PaaI family thioesterase [Desulfobacterales bacterium]|nr:PaaI family thioesterase [Desulfobacterales bacterium]
MSEKAFQDYYPDKFNQCYGCGSRNAHGYQLKSTWDGEESVACFTPEPYHMAVPGFVYGGLIASLIDCHSTGTAAAATYRSQGRPMDSEPALRFVTASLHVDYLAPTPLDTRLEIRARVEELTPKKVIVASTVTAGGNLCARGKVVAAQMPETMLKLVEGK